MLPQEVEEGDDSLRANTGCTHRTFSALPDKRRRAGRSGADAGSRAYEEATRRLCGELKALSFKIEGGSPITGFAAQRLGAIP